MVESNFFMKHFHFLFSAPIPHSAWTLKPTCILLNVHIASWSSSRSSFHSLILRIMNILSPMYLGLLGDTQNSHLHEWTFGDSLNKHLSATKCSHLDGIWGSLCLCIWIIHDGKKWLYCSLHKSYECKTKSCAPYYSMLFEFWPNYHQWN